MSILISIKPEYVQHILTQKKKFEFRKKINKDFCDRKVYIYSSAPTKKIVGYFVSSQIIEDSPEKIWKKCKKWAGIEEEDFFAYFDNKDIGFALEISKLKCFKHPIDPKNISPSFTPPQSYYYLDKELEATLSL
jgi:type I restriction enzyme S subunit